VFFERLSFEKCVAKCITQRADGIGEHVVEHDFTLQVCENRRIWRWCFTKQVAALPH
jgi:hypothetical protein